MPYSPPDFVDDATARLIAAGYIFRDNKNRGRLRTRWEHSDGRLGAW